jgi:hypothetical protein
VVQAAWFELDASIVSISSMVRDRRLLADGERLLLACGRCTVAGTQDRRATSGCVAIESGYLAIESCRPGVSLPSHKHQYVPSMLMAEGSGGDIEISGVKGG